MKNKKKIIKAIAGICLAACLAASFTISAAAIGENPADADGISQGWSSAVSYLSSDYSPAYASILEEYATKDNGKAISYGKSKTGKLMKKISSALSGEYNAWKAYAADGKALVGIEKFGAKAKYIAASGGSGRAIYANGGQYVSVEINDDYNVAVPSGAEEISACALAASSIEDKAKKELAAMAEIDIPGDAEGEYFRFKRGGKIYRVEKFKSGGSAVAVLYNEAGDPLAVKLNNNNAVGFSFGTDVSEADISLSITCKFMTVSIF